MPAPPVELRVIKAFIVSQAKVEQLLNFILSDKLVTNIEKINDKHFMSDESSVSGKL